MTMLPPITRGTSRKVTKTCPVCEEAKEEEVYVLGETLKIKVNCKCEQNRLYEKEKQEREEEEKTKRIEKWEKKTGKHKRQSFDADKFPQSKLSRLARRYCEHAQEMESNSHGLLLSGVKGCGKTYTSSCIGRELSTQGFTVEMVSTPTLVQSVTANKFSDTCLWQYIACDFLILDDLGAERQSEFSQEIIFRVVDERYIREQKPIIVGTNLSIRELQQEPNLLQGRIYDRLLERCYPVECEKINHRAELSCYNQLKDFMEE